MMETPMSGRNYVLGADFGSDSVRAVVVDLADGSMCAGSRMHIPKVGRWFVPDARGRDFPAASGGLPRSAGNGCRGSAFERPGDGSAKGGTGNRGGYHRLDAVPCRPGGNLLRLQGALKKNPSDISSVEGARRQAKREKSTAYSLTGMD